MFFVCLLKPCVYLYDALIKHKKVLFNPLNNHQSNILTDTNITPY